MGHNVFENVRWLYTKGLNITRGNLTQNSAKSPKDNIYMYLCCNY